VSQTNLRVLLADDHPIVLEGVKALVTAGPGLEVIGEARDGHTALRLATELKPDIAIVDISMPGLNGIRVTEMLRAACPTCKVLILTVHEDSSYLRELLEVGISGYILKRSASEELIRAIVAVAAGGLYLDPAIAGKAVAVRQPRVGVAEAADPVDLSAREVEVLRLTASGHSNKSMASELNISVKTVETYKARAMEKLGFRTRVELVRFVLGQGWLDS
jgi:DNA-binding NarL/FixJ family response regulator